MTVATGVLKVFTDTRRCPITDEGAGVCNSPATVLVRVAERFGCGAYMKLCLYHADMVEDD